MAQVAITGFPSARPIRELARWPRRRWLAAAAGACAIALLTGLPTDIVPNPYYARMTPVVWWDYPLWALTAVLAGLVLASYVRDPALRAGPASRREGRPIAGGVLSFLAVGCPICNKLVVALLGVSGALTYFGPAQPAIGVLGVALLAASLGYRLRALAGCPARG